jgi:hypothetical protein
MMQLNSVRILHGFINKFSSGSFALFVCCRLQQLKQIKLMIEDNREAFMSALSADLGR